MARKHYAKDTICIEANGLSIELDVVVTFTVTDYSPQTLTSPEEPCMVEDVDLAVTRNGKPVSLPVWLIEEISNGEGFKDWLLDEAAESDLAAREDAAEALRDEISFQSFVL